MRARGRGRCGTILHVSRLNANKQQFILIFGLASIFVTQSALGEVSKVEEQGRREEVADLFLKDTASHMAQEITRVTGVEVVQTSEGLELILETVAESERLVPLILPEGNDLVIDILDATLIFELRNGVTELNPAPGINRITVNRGESNSIRVRITGANQTPSAEVVPGRDDLVLSITPERATTEQQADEEIEVIATGQAEDDGYNVDNASVGTRTDTPLRDIPQSIQVVPQQVLEDQQATRLGDVIKNVPGAEAGGSSPRTVSDNIRIRGFEVNTYLRDGILNPIQSFSGSSLTTIEQLEVLKGPASVIYGNLQPGGTINFVTKKPLSEPFYEIEASIGNFDTYRGEIDLSAPLNDSQTVLYRFNASARTSEGFIDFVFDDRYTVSPALTFNFGENTSLYVRGEYLRIDNSFDLGVPAEGSVLPNPNGEIPRDRNLTDPDSSTTSETYRLSLDLEHEFNNNWRLRSIFLASFFTQERDFVFTTSLNEDLRTLERGGSRGNPTSDDDGYNFDTYITGNFNTGSIEHQLTAGVNLFWLDGSETGESAEIDPIDIFNPVYTSPTTPFERSFEREFDSNLVGIYLQDQVSFSDNFKLLLGGRLDFANQKQRDLLEDTESDEDYQDFSPRVGLVYQPIEPISLYASYSNSFNLPDPSFGDLTLEPETGTQYEIGVKTDLSDRLSTTLAFYDLTRSNLPTTDPNDPLRTIQVGEQQSQGIELDISGEILPGWNIIAGYAYTDAEITEDNNLPVGNQLNNVPENSFNFWTTYKIGRGSFSGLGFGLGLFVVGDRQGDLDNAFELPGYTRTDAAIFYERNRFKAAVNFENLFDVDYFASAQRRSRVFVGDPFTVIGSLSYEF